jgi:cytochrome P450
LKIYLTFFGLKIHEDGDPLQAKNLFNLRGQKWREVRSKLLPTFTSGKIKAMLPLMIECAEQFDEHLGRLADGDKTFEAKVQK